MNNSLKGRTVLGSVWHVSSDQFVWMYTVVAVQRLVQLMAVLVQLMAVSVWQVCDGRDGGYLHGSGAVCYPLQTAKLFLFGRRKRGR